MNLQPKANPIPEIVTARITAIGPNKKPHERVRTYYWVLKTPLGMAYMPCILKSPIFKQLVELWNIPTTLKLDSYVGMEFKVAAHTELLDFGGRTQCLCVVIDRVVF